MTQSPVPADSQRHVLLLIKDHEEAEWAAGTLAKAEIQVHQCEDMEDLCPKAALGFGAVLISAEFIDSARDLLLNDLIWGQEIWSDIPVLILAAGEDSFPASSSSRSNPHKGNFTLLQRPLSAATLASSMLVALRARRWQYEVRELLAQRQSILDSIHDSFVMVDQDWRLVYANQNATKMYGLARDKLLGRILWDALPELARNLYKKRLEEAKRNQKESRVEFFQSSSRHWFDIRISPSATGISIFATDITERKQADDKLRYQLGITQAITDNAADSLFLLDPKGRVTFMNPAAEETFGWKKEELLGKVLHDHVHYHKSHLAKVDCPLQSVFTSGLTLRDLEDQFHCKDGSRLNVSCSNAAITMDGQPTGAVLVVHDITYHKLAEHQLKALNENLELRVEERTAIAEKRAAQLSALASELTQTEQRERRRLAHILHDNLQQILVATKLQISMLRGRIENSQDRRDMLHIENLLNRSIEESRSLTVELSPPILYDAGLGRALEWLARRMKQDHDLTVCLEADPEAEPEGDDTRAFLFQAVREALFNIVKHSGVKKACIKIALAENGSSVIHIQDDGFGFEANVENQNEGSAVGFGLFSIRERLEFMGGRLAITSAPGQGTSVSLYIPLPAKQKATSIMTSTGRPALSTAGPAEPIPQKATGRMIRVLLVDDHKMLRDGLAGLLREQKDITVVSEASDGLMAIELAHQTDPDVIIMDITMPRMNGVEATRRLTTELPHIRVIGLSMHEKDDMAKAMREAGAVSYLTKGAPAEILTAAIRKCMLKEPAELRVFKESKSNLLSPTT